MVQPDACPVRWAVLVRGSVSAKSKRRGSWVESIVESVLLQLVRRRVNAALLSEGVRAGDGGTALPIPEGVPVKSIAEEEDEPAERVCLCPSI